MTKTHSPQERRSRCASRMNDRHVIRKQLPDRGPQRAGCGGLARLRRSHHQDRIAATGKQRAMQLEGRAYFEVRRDEQRPFTVDAGDLYVTVLGTAFEVADYDTAAFATVRVRTGHVRVVAGIDTVELLAGDHLRYGWENESPR